MAGTTPKYGFPYPTGTDRVADGDNAMQSLAVAIENKLWTVDTRPLPMVASSVFSASPATSQLPVTFPAGRFTAPPMVIANMSTGGNVALGVNVGGITASGCTFYIYPLGSGIWDTGGVSVFYLAIASIT